MAGHISLFLSHIDEETVLAQLLRDAIDGEFAGFVDIFSFSDANMNPAGGNIMRNIEDNLLRASAGVFLLSQVSLKRPWINFELGALWMRNVLAVHNREEPMPLVPICHSGLGINQPPMPINQLNAITGSNSADLKIAFEALQRAVGGRGVLRTNFGDLARRVHEFEIVYTIGSAFRDIWMSLCDKPFADVIHELDRRAANVNYFSIEVSAVEQKNIDRAMEIVREHNLTGSIGITVTVPGLAFTGRGTIPQGNVRVSFSSEFYKLIRGALDRLI